MKKRIIISTIFAAVVVAGVAVVIEKQHELAAAPKPVMQAPAVQTAEAMEGTLEISNRQIGELQPYIQADIAPRITGYILSVTKREGESVTKGETVCTIDDRELSRKVDASHAEMLASRQKLAGARSMYEAQRSATERDNKLYAAGAISKEALERSQANLDSLKSVVDAYQEGIRGQEQNTEAARLQVSYSRLIAPFSGIVTRRLAEPGDLAIPGKAVLTIQQSSPVKVVVQVPQELMGTCMKGMKLTLSNGSETVQAAISRVYPALGKNLLGSIEAVLPKSPFGLPAGSTVTVDIVTSAVKGIVVPENALVHTDKGTFIYLVNNGVINIRQVEVLGTGKGKAAVKGDLPSGTKIAVAQENKLLTLSEGMKVTEQGGRQ
ncbi:MAG TPA: efflux RND transporter periplasmic adaptor subunit [Dissulfurispiraceae bacterium]|nr:efflux RND transporter periplasmic adaptor subunit [Dissulfurispiraceae bacterium]